MKTPKTYARARAILFQDVVISLLASLLSILLVRWLSDPIWGFTLVVAKWLGAALVGTVAGVLVSGCYKDVRRHATVRSLAKTLVAIAMKEAVLLVALLTRLVVLPAPVFGLLALLSDLLLTGLILSYIRVSARLLAPMEAGLTEKASRKTALVAGTSAASLHMAAELEKQGYDVVGLLSRHHELSGRVISDHVVYCCTTDAELARLQWQLGGVDCVFFPRTDLEMSDLGQMGGGTSSDTPQQDGMSWLGHWVKRSFDIALSGILLLVFAPLIGICALLVKKEDGGPVIFAQERIGLRGKPFNIYKFRTMRVDAEHGTPALYSGEDDPRLTRTGRFLRAHHLDELPQLWNVFKGDMSFIGYRPERQYYIDQIMACNSRYRYLYQIRPGVTSYATLYNGYTDTLEKMLTRLDLDLYYLRNHSVWFDVKVLGLTFLSIVTGKKF